MKKLILAAALLLLIMNVQIVAHAEPKYLVVPAQYWSDGNYHPTRIKYYPDVPYLPYDGHTMCTWASRTIHANKSAPSYSMCMSPESLRQIRSW